MDDLYNLQRFMEAQAALEFGSPIYVNACSELRRGFKSSHWMWFIFPQFRGLGYSPRAVKYAIGSIEEAEAYLQHPVLGQRLRECSQILLQVDGISADQILGSIDAVKLRSSMTLFSRAAAADNAVFLQTLDKYFAGQPDAATLNLLNNR